MPSFVLTSSACSWQEQLTELIEQGAYQDICDRARHL